MTPDTIFSAANTIAAASWLVLIVAGKVRHVAGAIAGSAVPLLLSVVYVVLITAYWSGAEGVVMAQAFPRPARTLYPGGIAA